jgi:hypothetical protein
LLFDVMLSFSTLCIVSSLFSHNFSHMLFVCCLLLSLLCSLLTISHRMEEAKEDNKGIREATEAIEKTIVDNVCTALIDLDNDSLSLRHIFHREGLNMRYLG